MVVALRVSMVDAVTIGVVLATVSVMRAISYCVVMITLYMIVVITSYMIVVITSYMTVGCTVGSIYRGCVAITPRNSCMASLPSIYR